MSKVSIKVPSALAGLFQGRKEFEDSASSLGELFQRLVEKYGSPVADRFLNPDGKLKPIVNVYVNGRNARFSGGLDTRLDEGDVVSILPAVAGG